jgi:DNA topoisomerase-1
MKIICDREEEIDNFVPQEYWSLDAAFHNSKSEKFAAKFYGTESKKIELTNKEETDEVVAATKKAKFTVAEVKKGSRVKRPNPPFTTSTMQQEASKAYGYATSKVMSIAQQLYEGIDIKGEGTVGLVSYIRTDSVRISDEAYEDIKGYITGLLGEDYIQTPKPEYKSRARAQDAHEAIRPTTASRTPDSVKESLTKDQFKLYSLIWERFAASQMAPAVYDTVSAKIDGGGFVFKASGSVLKFAGYKAIFKKDDDDKSEPSLMVELTEGEKIKLNALLPEQHFTQPPARFSEAMLVKTLEENGVGRPSTYAPTISTIIARRYVVKENKMLYPTELGEIVNDIMKNNFEDIVSIDFTAKMEEDLDKVEDGEKEWKDVIRTFYPPFKDQIDEAEQKIGEIEIKDEETDVICENCGRNMVIKFGKFGKFLACPGFPECRNTLPFYEEAGVNCPLCDGKVMIKKTKKGRKYFGCENNPECGFISWHKPTGEKCPLCGDVLIEKGTKNRKIHCNNTECSYIKEIETEE